MNANTWIFAAALGLITTMGVAPVLAQQTQPPADSAVDVRLNLQLDEPTTQTAGAYVKAYTIDNESQMVPGNLGDAYFGDFVLETNQLRAVIARPGKPSLGSVQPGSLIDITTGPRGLDYLGSLNTTANPYSTGSLAIYTDARITTDSAVGTPAVSLTGHIGDPGTTAPAPDEMVSVQTKISTAVGSNTLSLTSTFTNQTTRTAYIYPGDVIDWGEATVFTPGVGFEATTATVQRIVGTVDDYSLTYYTTGTRMAGLQHGRDSIVLAHGDSFDLQAYNASHVTVPPEASARLPKEFQGIGASTEPAPGYVMFPGTETRYAPDLSGMPQPQPIYVPEARLSMKDGKATVSLEGERFTRIFQKPSSDRGGLVTLQPGESFTFTRFLQHSDGNWALPSRDAWQQQGTALGTLGGAVVESGTNRPIGGATIRISGGEAWDGTAPAPPVLQAKTRADGTFAVKLPAGKYVAEAEAIGRQLASKVQPFDITTTGPARVMAFAMSRQSLLRMAISEAETPTSSPLPVKVTIISKPPYPTENYGFRPDVTRGVRNVRYLPQGAAVFPITPGRYRLIISRGIEYDIIQKDIAVAPGQELTVTGALPHVMKQLLPGMVSMDAGVVTDASGQGFADAQSRAIQAACEGVQVLVSGDYGQVTDLQQAIADQGLTRWVRAFAGRRVLLHKDNLSADLFVYPLDAQSSETLDKALRAADGLPPDVAIADLKQKLPNLIFEVSRPMHAEAGYLTDFPFNSHKMEFQDGLMPPPDFSAIQLMEGKKIAQEQDIYPRYMGMQLGRLAPASVSKAPPLSGMGSSFSRLPYGQEIGYPRVYLYLKNGRTLEQLTASDIVTAVRGQHYMVTNGPILLFDALNYNSMRFDVEPGDIVDLHTTDVLRIRAQVLAAPWVTLNGVKTRENGLTGVAVQNIEQTENVVRYPARGRTIGSNVYARYLKEDAVVDAMAFSTIRTLEPVVPNPLIDFGGELYPFAWSGPIFVDRDGDGKISIPEKQP